MPDKGRRERHRRKEKGPVGKPAGPFLSPLRAWVVQSTSMVTFHSAASAYIGLAGFRSGYGDKWRRT